MEKDHGRDPLTRLVGLLPSWLQTSSDLGHPHLLKWLFHVYYPCSKDIQQQIIRDPFFAISKRHENLIS
jgi:hypothetical protein